MHLGDKQDFGRHLPVPLILCVLLLFFTKTIVITRMSVHLIIKMIKVMDISESSVL